MTQQVTLREFAEAFWERLDGTYDLDFIAMDKDEFIAMALECGGSSAVERDHATVGVGGSIPLLRSKLG